jgi:hypothetical protein
MDKIGASLFESVKKMKEDLSLLHVSYKPVGIKKFTNDVKNLLNTEVVIETAINSTASFYNQYGSDYD